MDIFNFAQVQQRTHKYKRPTWEETLNEAKESYKKFGKGLTISEEDYIMDIRRHFESLNSLTDEEYDAHIVHQNIRKNTMLASLDKALQRQIEKIKQDKKLKEERKLINRIKKWFQRMF